MNINDTPTTQPIFASGATVNMTNNTLNTNWSRDGKFVTLGLSMTFNGPSAAVSNCIFTLPSFLTIDLANLASATVGYGRIEDIGTNRYSIQGIVLVGNQIAMRVLVTSGAFGTDADITHTVPFTMNVGDVLDIYLRFPVSSFNTTAIEDL